MKTKGITLKTAKKAPGTISRAKVRKVVAAVYSGSFPSAWRSNKYKEVFVINNASANLQLKGN
jgi:hypothetical protein